MFLILYQITKVCLLVESRGKSERVFALVEKKKKSRYLQRAMDFLTNNYHGKSILQASHISFLIIVKLGPVYMEVGDPR